MKKRVLLTGISGAAAVSFYKSIPRDKYEFFVAASETNAGGFSLVPESNRIILPCGSDEKFVENLLKTCVDNKIDVVIPTVDSELLPIAKSLVKFDEIGVKVLCESFETLQICKDKSQLIQKCGKPVFVPRSAIFDSTFNENDWTYPVFVKHRTSDDLNGFGKIDFSFELSSKPRNSNLLIQEYLPGVEFSVDVIANEDGEIVAAVPRERFKNNLEITATTRTLRNERLEIYAKVVARKIGLKYVANIQFKLDETGEPMVLGVKPHFLGNNGLTVKSGINMPLLSLQSILGEKTIDSNLQWNELEITRHRHDYFYEFQEKTPQEIETKETPTSTFVRQPTKRPLTGFMFMEFLSVLKNY